MAENVEIHLKAKNDASSAFEQVSGDAQQLSADLKNSADSTGQFSNEVKNITQKLDALAGRQQSLEYFKDLTVAAYGTRTELTKARNSLSELEREFNATATPSRQLTRSFEQAKQKVAELELKTKSEAETLTTLSRSLREVGINTKTLTQDQHALAREIEVTSQKAEVLRVKMRVAAQRSQQLSESEKEAAKQADNLGGGLKRAAAGMLAFIAAGVGLQKIKQYLTDILSTGGKFETFRVQLEGLMGSVAAGESAFSWIKDFTKRTPLQLDETTQAFVKLKSFGLDPMDGTLQSLVDLNAKLGGGQERLNGIILGVGQAWAKQKLQAEEIMQLVERGVPVYDLLNKAIGKSTAEIQDMSAAGELGREAIAALIHEMGSSSLGQAQKEMKIWTGLVSNARDEIDQFLNRVAESGALDYFKDQLSSILKTTNEMAKDGRIKEYAKRISDFMINGADAAKRFVGVLADLSSKAQEVVTTFIAFKIGSFITGMYAAATATGAVAAALKGFTLALARTGIGAVVVGAGYLVAKFLELGDAADKSSQKLAEQNQKSAEMAQKLVDISEKTGVLVSSEEELNKALENGTLKLNERTGQYEKVAKAADKAVEAENHYKSNLTGVSDEITRQAVGLLGAASAGKDFAEQIAKMTEKGKSLSEALKGLNDDEFAKFLEQANGLGKSTYFTDIEKAQIQVAALEASYDRLGINMESFQTGISTSARVALSSLDSIAASANVTGEQLILSLKGALNEINSDTELDQVNQRIQAWAETGKLSSEQLGLAMADVKDKAAEISGGLTEAEKAMVNSFRSLANNAESTASQILGSFTDNLSQISTQAGLQQLVNEFNSVEVKARLTNKQIADGLKLAEKAARDLTNQVQLGAVAFTELGKSIGSANTVKQLNEVRDAINEAFGAGQIGAEQYNELLDATNKKKEELIKLLDKQLDREKAINDEHKKDNNDALKEEVKIRSVAINQTERQAKAMKLASEEMGKSHRMIMTTEGYFKYLHDVEALANKYSDAADNAAKFADKSLTVAQNGKATVGQLESMARALEKTIKSTKALDSQTLGNLQSALQATSARIQQMKSDTESAKSELLGLQSELAGLEGNQRRVQQIQNLQRQADLEAKRAAAEAEGNDAAVKSYSTALSLLQKIDRIKQKNIRSEREAQQNQQSVPGNALNTPAAANTLNTPARTVLLKFEDQNGKQAQVTTSEGDADTVINMLQNNRGASAR